MEPHRSPVGGSVSPPAPIFAGAGTPPSARDRRTDEIRLPDPFQAASAFRLVEGDGQGGTPEPPATPGRGARSRLGGFCPPAPFGAGSDQTLSGGGAAL